MSVVRTLPHSIGRREAAGAANTHPSGATSAARMAIANATRRNNASSNKEGLPALLAATASSPGGVQADRCVWVAAR